MFRNTFIFIFRNAITLLVIALFFSCENDLQEIKSITEFSEEPPQTVKEVEILYSDSGLVQVRLKAPLMYYFDQKDDPYFEFPSGIEMYFLNRELVEESKLTANYSIYYTNRGIWEAKFNVVAVNQQGETLNTEYLIWDEKIGKIYSDKCVKVTDQDGIIYGDGFEANQYFTKWKILNPKGYINLEE